MHIFVLVLLLVRVLISLVIIIMQAILVRYSLIMDIKYTGILQQGEKCLQFSLLKCIYLFIVQFVHLVGEGIGVKGFKGVIVILARCEFHFIREHENVV